jgi:hypothetical protein
LGWTDEEAKEKIRLAADMGIDAPCFKAPAWLLDGDVYTACEELGYTVCSHEKFRIVNTGVREYIYNMHFGHSKSVTPLHGHLTPVENNHIYQMRDSGFLTFDKDIRFAFPWEVAVTTIVTKHVRPERERLLL